MQTQATDVDTSLIGPGTFKGAVKALPHMTRTELYWEYAAFAECRGIATGSYGIFMKAINKVIGPNIRDGHLRFRATNEHGQCDTCFELRKACREAKTEAARREARSRHHMHVLSQWLDRQIYWSFRTLSYNFFFNSFAGQWKASRFELELKAFIFLHVAPNCLDFPV